MSQQRHLQALKCERTKYYLKDNVLARFALTLILQEG